MNEELHKGPYLTVTPPSEVDLLLISSLYKVATDVAQSIPSAKARASLDSVLLTTRHIFFDCHVTAFTFPFSPCNNITKPP